MPQPTPLFPALRDPLARLCLLLVAGLYTASFFPRVSGMSGWDGFLYPLRNVAAAVRAPGFSGGDLVLFVLKNWLRWASLLYPWLPNPLLWIGVTGLLMGRRHVPWVAGGLALLSALHFGLSFWLDLLDVSIYLTDWPEVVGAYFLWLASMAVLTAVGAYRALRPRARPAG